MKTIGAIVNIKKPEAADTLKRLVVKAKALGLKLLITADAAALLPNLKPVGEAELLEKAEALIVLGGDGTMLGAVRALAGRATPLLGVNIGSLGFMTSVPEEELEHALAALVAGQCTLETRSLMACCHKPAHGAARELQVLNELAIGWGATSKMVTLEVTVDDEPVTAYACDGMIIATPTGSTGHSLSAGGPLLHPQTPAFIVTVVCPHTLSTRPLVVADHSVIGVRVSNAPKQLLFSCDGQEHPLGQGDRLDIRRSPSQVRFAHMPGYSYFAVLRQKLHWRGSSLL
jgi:NAD+ kinase